MVDLTDGSENNDDVTGNPIPTVVPVAVEPALSTTTTINAATTRKRKHNDGEEPSTSSGSVKRQKTTLDNFMNELNLSAMQIKSINKYPSLLYFRQVKY